MKEKFLTVKQQLKMKKQQLKMDLLVIEDALESLKMSFNTQKNMVV